MEAPPATLSTQAQSVQRANEDGPLRLAQAIYADDPVAVEAVLAEGMQEVLLGPIFDAGANALHLAVSMGQTAVVTLLLRQYGMDPNTANADGWTPLHIAAEKGHDAAATALLNHGAEPNALTSDDRDTPLHVALMFGHAKVACVLLDRQVADVHARRVNGMTPFYLAIDKGLLDIAERLRLQGANMDTPAAAGWSPVQCACVCGTPDTLRWLLQRGINIQDKKMPEGWTILHAAATNARHPEVIDVLRGAMSADAFRALALTKDRCGTTPGTLAAEVARSLDRPARRRDEPPASRSDRRTASSDARRAFPGADPHAGPLGRHTGHVGRGARPICGCHSGIEAGTGHHAHGAQAHGRSQHLDDPGP
ncbi:ankyrin repeat domain-containing protein [Hydrogenophaga sp.]|uniref:ankyrin repeat domain-containing protein n=1 Tax=Hydrogenophaga sp. TaxID=1904254 RepID=UPI00271DBD49|nr:ankyrin repeat domain-containing protein [Hydrogenophaga sp.]MDO9438575.1 ankyrin repeat domain-containing protein [Hydrogenophaga sp.]